MIFLSPNGVVVALRRLVRDEGTTGSGHLPLESIVLTSHKKTVSFKGRNRRNLKLSSDICSLDVIQYTYEIYMSLLLATPQ